MLKKALKNAQKTHFSGKVILRYFQKYVRYGSNVFWGPKHIPWAHSEAITRPPTHSTAKTPSSLVNSFLFWRFFYLFLLPAWARPKISQHLLTKILESATHTLKPLNLKYYHHTTPKSVNFLFSKPLLPNASL